jgi:uncharacterized membrane protein YfcA
VPLAGLAYAAFGASFASHTTGALVAILVPATVVLVAVLVLRRPRGTVTRVDRTHVPWLVWLVAFGVWELVAFVRNDLTISLLMDPVLVIYPLRVAGWVLWLWAGWLVVRPRASLRASR